MSDERRSCREDEKAAALLAEALAAPDDEAMTTALAALEKRAPGALDRLRGHLGRRTVAQASGGSARVH